MRAEWWEGGLSENKKSGKVGDEREREVRGGGG